MFLNKGKNIRYLNIAGFLIKINFLKPDYEKTRLNFISMIDLSFAGFLIGPTLKKTKPDFYIEIKPTATYMFLNSQKNAFVRLYVLSDKQDRITTYYSISIHQFQLILMRVLFWLLTNRGFIVHCSAVKISNGAILFLGKQGAGKSTTANLLSDTYEVLADDNGIIREKMGNYYFYQSPSIEKNESIRKTESGYPIQALFFLNKAHIYKTIKLIDKEFILKKMTYQFLGDLRNRKQKIEFLLKMVNNFKCFYSLFTGKDKIKLKQLINNE